MNDIVRQKPPFAASELTMLNTFLDYQRTTLLQKVAGVSDSDLRRSPLAPVMPTSTSTAPGMTLLGLVKHLAYTEQWWFQAAFAGLEVAENWTDDDPDADWRVEKDETTDQILNFYQVQTAKSRELVSQCVSDVGGEVAALESYAKKPEYAERTLRWIMFHLLEETARHDGHADFLREAIDGAIGV